LFFAVGPTSWQLTHFLNAVAPAVTSCALAAPADTAATAMAINIRFISSSPVLNGRLGLSLDRDEIG
jgi:hypothetical protein